MKFGNATKVPAKRVLKYYRLSWYGRAATATNHTLDVGRSLQIAVP